VKTKQKELPMAKDYATVKCCPKHNYEDFASPGTKAHWVTGQVETASGPIDCVSTNLILKDFMDTIKMRFGMGRMNYAIPPGLYGIGKPDSYSPVLVSANYKLSFDSLRRYLSGFNLWILVLDTKGINVWCAAGKGTFGTTEINRMVKETNLSGLVSHRNLILPQLAAPGVAAQEVRSQTGFNVVYGPVRASDITYFLEAGYKVKKEMRRTSFTLLDRLVLTPVEAMRTIKPLLGLAVLLFLLNLVAFIFNDDPFILSLLLGETVSSFAPFLIAVLVGTVLVPVMLPYIPGRPLAWKGWVLGVILTFGYTTFIAPDLNLWETAAHYLMLPAITAFLGMNFTGSTTYTSLSGVVKEMGIALPLIIVSASLGVITLCIAYFI